ncbi:MAG: hypothetical protein C4336_06600, partial [Armatimonadota bacterium]
DPRTARWLQRDPMGVAGGHPNVYGYCFNSPLIWKDPSGLQFVIFVHGILSSPNVFEKKAILVLSRRLLEQRRGTISLDGEVTGGQNLLR